MTAGAPGDARRSSVASSGACASGRTRGTSEQAAVTTNERPAIINDRYELSKRIGRGGMADVFLGRDRLLDRQVAIKVLFPEFAVDPNFVERFRREAQAAANLSHPNIVNVYDWGRHSGTYFIAMEYVHGRTLADILRSNGQVTAKQAGGDRQRGRRGAQLRPRGRSRPPRHQAGQHPHRRQRPGEGRRLRHRPSRQRADRVQPHPGGCGHGDGDVLLARAGPGCPARPAQRPLLARHRDVRDGRRPPAVHRREPRRHRLQAGPRQPSATEPDRARRSPAVRGDRRQAAGEGPQGALRDGQRRCATTCAASATASPCWPSPRRPGRRASAPRARPTVVNPAYPRDRANGGDDREARRRVR